MKPPYRKRKKTRRDSITRSRALPGLIESMKAQFPSRFFASILKHFGEGSAIPFAIIQQSLSYRFAHILDDGSTHKIAFAGIAEN
jgi:hypothetical protein